MQSPARISSNLNQSIGNVHGSHFTGEQSILNLYYFGDSTKSISIIFIFLPIQFKLTD